MPSEYEKYERKVAQRKRTPESSVKIGDAPKPAAVEPRKRDERKRH